MPIAIAIDGPAGAGKSTIAKEIAHALGALYLDTGAMYRCVGLHMLRKGISTTDVPEVAKALSTLVIRVGHENGRQRTYLFDEDVSDSLRTPAIDQAATNVATIVPVREYLVSLQREIAKGLDIVMDGRDIGTHVLPNAQVKIFCTASVETRAQRRYDERIAKGIPADYDAILAEMIERDRNDSTRAASPLVQAEDAVLLDTTQMTVSECVQFVCALADNARKELLS